MVGALARRGGMDWVALERVVGEGELEQLPSTPDPNSYKPKFPGFFERLVPYWRERFNERLKAAEASFHHATKHYEATVQTRQERLNSIRAEVDKHNQNLREFREAYRVGNPKAVAVFFDLVFEKSRYPEGFPSKRNVGYIPDSKQLIVDFDLPTLEEIIPAVERYRYTKSSDQIAETKKAHKVRQSLYSSVVSQAVLRRLYEIFVSDSERVVDVATVSAYVKAIDPSNGQRVRPCLVSVRTTRDEFEKLDLRHVDPIACLKRLNAAVSRSPAELIAVKPIIEFNMVDPRFIQETDVLSDLDNRPNLMELTPSEFENLITNLFQRMGLETKLTQASRDGGVDCVAYDPRPILGGKVVVQAKRYKNTVGVSAVRDLFGTMLNEGASKGILVTTSGYGKASFEFANDKPIELLDGSNLIYLLKEHAGIDAKIIVPADWSDPSSS